MIDTEDAARAWLIVRPSPAAKRCLERFLTKVTQGARSCDVAEKGGNAQTSRLVLLASACKVLQVGNPQVAPGSHANIHLNGLFWAK